MNIGQWSLGLVTDYEDCRQGKKETFFVQQHSHRMYIKTTIKVFLTSQIHLRMEGFHFQI